MDSAWVEYASEVVGAVHESLLQQTDKPWCTQPDFPVDGWSLVATHITETFSFVGFPRVVSYLGSRSIYLANKPGVVCRVLTVPHPRRPFVSRTIDVRATTVPDLLAEDPTLCPALVHTAHQTVEEFGLRCILPVAPIVAMPDGTEQ